MAGGPRPASPAPQSPDSTEYESFKRPRPTPPDGRAPRLASAVEVTRHGDLPAEEPDSAPLPCEAASGAARRRRTARPGKRGRTQRRATSAAAYACGRGPVPCRITDAASGIGSCSPPVAGRGALRRTLDGGGGEAVARRRLPPAAGGARRGRAQPAAMDGRPTASRSRREPCAATTWSTPSASRASRSCARRLTTPAAASRCPPRRQARTRRSPRTRSCAAASRTRPAPSTSRNLPPRRLAAAGLGGRGGDAAART